MSRRKTKPDSNLPSNDDSNETKFNYLYNKYKEFVMYVSKRHIKNHLLEDAEDVSSHVWDQIWSNIHKVDFNHPHLKNYIMRTAVFTAINTAKKKSNVIYYDFDNDNVFIDKLGETFDADATSIADVFLYNENQYSIMSDLVRTSIDDENYDQFRKKLASLLTEDQISVIEMLFIEDMSYMDIVKKTGLSRRKISECLTQSKLILNRNNEIFE